MKISFDFDCTLSEPHIQDVARRAIEEGHELYITTARFEHACMPLINNDVRLIAAQVGIPQANIRFTNDTCKSKYLQGFDVHFDDSFEQLENIRAANATIELIHVGDDMHLRNFDKYFAAIKTTPAGKNILI